MRYFDVRELPLNVPTLILAADLSEWEFIRLSQEEVYIHLIDSYEPYYQRICSINLLHPSNMLKLDEPTDEDTAEYGVLPQTSQKLPCTCDFVSQILPYGCKCGGK